MILQINRDPQSGKLTATLEISEILKPLYDKIEELENKVNELKISEIKEILTQFKQGIEITAKYVKA